jgi:hypothetical protein
MALLGCAAALAVAAPCAHAADYCVGSAGELASALAAAGSHGQDNTVRLRAGSFLTSAAAFTYGNLGNTALTIEGGYDDTCSNQDPTPGLSVLDGANLSQVLSLQSNGDMTIRHVTIQNAFYGSSAGGGVSIAMNSPTTAATTIFDSNVVRNNVDTYAAGGLSVFGLGTVYVQNNLFTGNSAPATAAFSTNMGDGSTSYITNNTITDNTNTGANNPIIAIGGGSPTAIAYVTNTISYGNHGSGLKDFYLYGFQTVQFVANNYTTIDGAVAPGSDGNMIGVDPMFAGAGDYHLRSTSPLLRAGTITPAGGLPATDLEGNPRSVNNRVDIGAYESADFIFADGFGT